jgi:glycosyltransferase involved in cell wall biosynthesis
MSKKRILFVSDFSKLSTGYAVYTNELLDRLHATGKYELAELACYCPVNHPEIKTSKWKVYPNLPDAQNRQELSMYESNPVAEFGEWKFEYTCLDFKPDIVCCIRDFWMDSYIDMSPFRRFYKTVMMPTVDATPQHSDWIDLYVSTDAVLAYNDWSLGVLRDEGGGLINLKGSAPPSANQDHFRFITDKKAHKRSFGLKDDTFIIGMVGRNQRRKLYPDFADSAVKLLEKLSPEQRNKTYFYWHTAYPDLGWEIPLYLKNNGLGSRILFSYICNNCRFFHPSFYKDARAVCPRCKTGNLTLPNTQIGLQREELGSVVGIFDAYVQYATNEGFGVPLVEAAFCGVPIFANDYSAMTDVLTKLNGYRIKNNLLYECETGRKLSMPDNNSLVEQLIKYINMPEAVRNRKRVETYNLAKQHYSSWETVAQKWMSVFDELPENSLSWNSQPIIIPPVQQIPSPQEMPDEKFVTYIIHQNLGNTRLVNKYIGLKLYRDLLWGRVNEAKFGGIYNEMSHMGYRPKYNIMDRNKLAGILNQIREKQNFWENQRWNSINKSQT